MKKIILFCLMLLLLGCATKKQASKELVVIPQDTINTTLVDSIAKGNPVDSITKETKEKSDTVIIAPQVVTVPQIQTSETIHNLPKINAPIIAGEHIYGHINKGKVLMELPEYQQAVHKMDSLQRYLAEQYKAMQIEQQTKQQELASDTTLLPMMREMKEAELQSLKDRINYFLSYSELQLVEEENRLLAPINQKIQTVIKETGEELKLLYVFDNSYLLVSSESSLDITPIVLNKMLQK